ncbi:retropepsin-like aspartic protease family protein [Marinobacterium jannaschii]|uniref:retropepsin-like aspartic protease family protein n=1 Tax=Marinobacterium jannaschii TaxID=64970 RepID=UPI000480916E|nr:TIGR02281 family clan AA aspartic protease [Marinobacterium jannaschii]
MRESDQPGYAAGRYMFYAFWITLLAVLTIAFNNWHADRLNPNAQLSTTGEGREVVLKRNSYGHYVVSGSINGQPVTFLLDTGATAISIPAAVADRLQLDGHGYSRVNTANGTISVENISLDSVAIGPIRLRNIRANINPHMHGDTVLLGMSFMRHLEMIQRDGKLTLRL